MQFSHTMSGGGPVIKRYLAGESMQTAGVPIIGTGAAADNANSGGVQLIAAVGANVEAVVGLTIDTNSATPYSDRDGQVNADADVLISAVVNPDAVYRAKLAQGTTADTALTAVTATASATGDGGLSDIVAGNAVWFLTGANAGAYPRRAADTTTVVISFPSAIAAGDTFTTANGFAGLGIATGLCDLTSDLTQLDANTVAADGPFVFVDFDVRDASDDGVNNSHYLVMCDDHLFAGNTQLS